MNISFIHTGDLHLGRQFHFKYNGDSYGARKRAELWKTFEKIVTITEKNQIDLLMIAGDFFDSAEADLSEIYRVAERLKQLTKTKVVIIAGNHDFYKPFSVYDLIQWPDNVAILKSGKMESVYFQSINTEVFGLSWQKDTYHKMPFNGHINLDEEKINILMLHGDAYHKESIYMPIDLNQFDHFDYVALGHIHKPDSINQKTAYCGSPEALSFGESGEHGIITGKIEDHHCRTEFVPLQGRFFITEKVNIEPEMTMDQIINAVIAIDDHEGRSKNYYRIQFCGICDIDLDRKWLLEELRHYFYYLEIDDSELEVNLNFDEILADNDKNVIGDFIRKMRQNQDDPIAKRALMIGLRGLLKEGMTFNDHKNP